MATIEEQALKEWHEEQRRRAIEAAKERLRRPWWKKIFPWKFRITIERR